MTSAVIAVTVLRRGAYQDWRLVVLDVGVAAAILLLQAGFTHLDDRINSWTLDDAGPGNAAEPAADGDRQQLCLRCLRRAGDGARHRLLLLHDQETVLRLLSEPVLDPTLAALLQKQAASGALRIRAFLDGGSMPDAGDGTLAGSVRQATAQFSDLPMTVSTDLATDVVLAPEAAHPLGQAIVTLLHNVRAHSAATTVVVHAAGDDREGWEVSVQDNRCGFDPSATPPGFGLSRHVHAALEPHRIAAHVTAVVGDATLVVLRFSPDAAVPGRPRAPPRLRSWRPAGPRSMISRLENCPICGDRAVENRTNSGKILTVC